MWSTERNHKTFASISYSNELSSLTTVEAITSSISLFWQQTQRNLLLMSSFRPAIRARELPEAILSILLERGRFLPWMLFFSNWNKQNIRIGYVCWLWQTGPNLVTLVWLTSEYCSYSYIRSGACSSSISLSEACELRSEELPSVACTR